MTRRVAILVALGAAIVLGPRLHAYLKLGTSAGGHIVQLRWTHLPVRYFVTNRDVAGVTAGDFQSRIARAFSSWTSVPTASVSAEFGGFVNAEPGATDGASVIGFRSRPDLDRVLGSTSFTVDTVTGELLESDIFLNSAFAWSVAPGGESGRYDVESIAAHEIGHLLGLSHSALGETALSDSGRRSILGKRAVMFPIAYPSGNIEDRSLEADDEAGLTDIYGTSAARRDLGSMSGRVTLNGAGVFGAHVVAFNPTTGTSTGGFTLTADGAFVIAGLTRGMYVVRAEPLDDADVDSFFDSTTAVNINFKPGYAAKLVAVPAGGSGGTIEIKVSGK